MAEPWNRVNIPFPCAVSTVHTQVSSTTAGIFKVLLLENEKVRKLLLSTILQTEIRVLYELLYILNNSHRQNKMFKGLKQVEQCINRLKNMKLDAALQDLADLCPNQGQMALCNETGECDVPSQPMLEWTCLKVLGACKLLCCTLTRCSRTFILSKQHLKWEEFIILNMVITSMLSRLWMIFRGILVGLAMLYQSLLELLKDVAQIQPMPYLTDISLPADVAELLGPSNVFLLKKHQAFSAHGKNQKIKQQRKKEAPVEGRNKEHTENMKEDLGILVERGSGFDAYINPFTTTAESVSEELHKTDEKQKLKKQVEDATTFALMSANLDELILWCKSRRMKRTKRFLTFLHLKCKRLECLEAAGYNMQRKLQIFRQEVYGVLSPQGLGAKTFNFSAAPRRTAGRRSHLQSLRVRFRFKIRTGNRKTRLIRRQKESELPVCFTDDKRSRAALEAALHLTDSGGYDDIDNIFACAGL